MRSFFRWKRLLWFCSECDLFVQLFSFTFLGREGVRDGYDRARHAVIGTIHILEAVQVTPYFASAPEHLNRGRRRFYGVRYIFEVNFLLLTG